MKKLNFLHTEDEALIREGVRALLSKEPYVKNIYESPDAKTCYEILDSVPVDIVLIDIKLPGANGLELVRNLVDHRAHPKVIVVTGYEGIELILNLLKIGVHGIVYKLDGYREISKTIDGVMENDYYFPERITYIIQRNAHRWDNIPPITLSFQENELLKIIATGLTTKQIASELKMTEATTETYRTRLIKKLGVPNSAALLAYAYRNGIL